MAGPSQLDFAAPFQTTTAGESRLNVEGGEGRANGSAPLRPVLRPVVRRASLQGFQAANPLHELASMPAEKPRRSADCQSQSAFTNLATEPAAAARFGSSAANHSMQADGTVLPNQARQSSDAKSMQASWQHQLMPIGGNAPPTSLPLLQSPFAALAAMPMQPRLIPVLSHLGATATCHFPHMVPKPSGQVATFSPNTSIAAEAVKQASPPNACGGVYPATCRADQIIHRQHRTEPADAPDATQRPGLTVRLPLSPSSIRSCGQANLQQPLAKTQHRALQTASTALGGSGRKRSYAQAQEQCMPAAAELAMTTSQAVPQTEVLPGRNVIMAALYEDDLTHLQIMSSRWCW